MDYIKFSEDTSKEVTGETAEGEQLLLGPDVLIYLKLVGFEQPVLDRLRRSDDTLRDELDMYKGHLFLGDSEAIRSELHAQVDKLFEAIKTFRRPPDEK